MAVREIVKGEAHPVLRRVAKEARRVTKDLTSLCEDLLDTVVTAAGAGLAAPQFGVSSRVCVARVGGSFLILINPEITWCSAEIDLLEEGCLSLPDVWVEVPRHRAIVVRYRDERWREEERRLEDLDARVVQHEVDHLNGRLIIDYAKPVARPSVHPLSA